MIRALAVITVLAVCGTARADDKLSGTEKCRYVAAGPAPVLIRGARLTTIPLWPPSSECQARIAEMYRRGSAVASPNTQARRTAPVVLQDKKSEDVKLNAVLDRDPTTREPTIQLLIDFAIPADLGEGTHTFEIKAGADSVIGEIELPVASITPSAPLHVRYADDLLDRLQDGVGALTDAKQAIAVVSDPSSPVENTVSIALPDILPPISGAYFWEVSQPSWPITILENAQVPTGQSSDHFTRIERPSVLRFTVSSPQASPLKVVLSLRSWNVDAPPSEPWFSVELTLAHAARNESLPLPIARHMRVSCGGAESEHNGIIAIDDDALETGRCSLRIPASEVERFGPQTIQITVSRDKAKPHTAIADASTDGNGKFGCKDEPRSLCLPLFPPDEDSKGEGVYTIEATVASSVPQAVYRSGSTRTLVESARYSPNYAFSARLRPRGRFATGKTYRVFATVPVDLATMRFPARLRDVDRSSEGSTVQFSSLSAGIHFVIEPWDYARAKNSWAIPVQGVLGVSVFELTEGRTAPSLVAGGKVVLGTLGDKLPASVTVGAFYELDLITPSTGSHFLLTVDLNFLSFFGAQSNAK